MSVEAASLSVVHAVQLDPLPSWNDGDRKQRLLAFVQHVTDPASADYVPPAARIATFDNDGMLWCEQPLYVQLAFVIDRLNALAPEHPEWATPRPFQAVLAGDQQAPATFGLQGLAELLAATHAGMTTEEFDGTVRAWFATARHPRFQRPYTDLAYQPMVELLADRRANDFKTYVVSGGGIEFMRAVAPETYGIPPEQVIGSSGRTRYKLRDGMPVLARLPELDFYNDGDGKPMAIQKFIGRRPLAAFGNSDGDQQLLQRTVAGSGRRLALLVDHTDAEREFAYCDAPMGMGRLEQALDEARRRDWLVVDMQADWRRVFTFEA